jgi:hypothetical protein
LSKKCYVSQYPKIMQCSHGIRKINDNIENLLRPKIESINIT